MCNDTKPKPSIDVEFLMGLIDEAVIRVQTERDAAGRHTFDGQQWSAIAKAMRQFGQTITEGLHDHPERFNNA